MVQARFVTATEVYRAHRLSALRLGIGDREGAHSNYRIAHPQSRRRREIAPRDGEHSQAGTVRMEYSPDMLDGLSSKEKRALLVKMLKQKASGQSQPIL